MAPNHPCDKPQTLQTVDHSTLRQLDKKMKKIQRSQEKLEF